MPTETAVIVAGIASVLSCLPWHWRGPIISRGIVVRWARRILASLFRRNNILAA